MTRTPLPESHFPRLAGFGLEDIRRDALWLYRYEKGEYLSHEGEPLTVIQFILSGRVKISVASAAGRTVMFCFDIPGDVIGSIEAMQGLPLTATSQAVTPVECIALHRDENAEFLHSNVKYLRFLCDDLSLAFARSSKNSATNILYPLETRLCSYIAMTQEAGHFSDNLTEVSELLGTSYRHLLRTLEGLCEKGILQKRGRGGYAVLDAPRLEALAEEYYSLR